MLALVKDNTRKRHWQMELSTVTRNGFSDWTLGSLYGALFNISLGGENWMEEWMVPSGGQGRLDLR